MSGGGSETQKSKQTQTVTPYAPATDQINDVLSQAQNLDQTLQANPIGGTTQNALNLITQRAENGSPLNTQANSTVSNLMTSPNSQLSALSAMSANPSSMAGGDTLSGIASGDITNTGLAPLTAMANGNLPSNPNLSTLQDFAGGKYLNSNPYLTAALQPGSDALTQATNALFSAGGRTGSGANQDVLEKNIGNYWSAALNNNYQQQSQNQLSAASTLGGYGQQDIGDILAAATSAAGYGQDNVANRAAAATQLGSNQLNAGQIAANVNASDQARQLTAAQAAPGIANNDYSDLMTLLQTGQAQDQIPVNILDWYANLVNGVGSQYKAGASNGTTSTTQEQSLLPGLIGAAGQIGASALAPAAMMMM